MIKMLVPRLGESVDELTIIRWLKKEGERVVEFEPIVEVETDKVITEIPSPGAGVLLKISTPENSSVSVGAIMAWIGEEDEMVTDSSTPNPKPLMQMSEQQDQKNNIEPQLLQADRHRINKNISPIAKKMAAELNVNIVQVKGTGLNGRITKDDILSSVVKNNMSKQTGQEHLETTVSDKLIPITTIRRQIAERMQNSLRISPHVLTVMEADMSAVVTHKSIKHAEYQNNGTRLTITAYLIFAIANALKRFPLANSSWNKDGLLLHHDINIGVATSLGDEGLIVPVIKHTDRLSLIGIARAINDLSTRARSHQLLPDEVRGGTFTLTNHGTGGSLFAMPIINQPQCGILGTGRILKRPVVITDHFGQDAIAVRPIMNLSYVFDHRILDGASADIFLALIKENLESFTDR